MYCPICGEEGRTAKRASSHQIVEMKKAWIATPPPRALLKAIRTLGIEVTPIDDTVKNHLKELVETRKNGDDSHLFCHAHIRGRAGWSAGDYKSRKALHLATTRNATFPSFAPQARLGSPSQLGKFIEKELGRRSELRSGSINVRSFQSKYLHPENGVLTSCEIDGVVDENTPIEIMSVENLDSIASHKISSKLHQVAEGAISYSCDQSFLMIVERGASRRITLLRVSKLVVWHLQSVKSWIGGLDR